jgi:hypothetical protein
VQSGGTSPWGYLKAHCGIFALRNKCPAVIGQSTGVENAKDI